MTFYIKYFNFFKFIIMIFDQYKNSRRMNQRGIHLAIKYKGAMKKMFPISLSENTDNISIHRLEVLELPLGKQNND